MVISNIFFRWSPNSSTKMLAPVTRGVKILVHSGNPILWAYDLLLARTLSFSGLNLVPSGNKVINMGILFFLLSWSCLRMKSRLLFPRLTKIRPCWCQYKPNNGTYFSASLAKKCRYPALPRRIAKLSTMIQSEVLWWLATRSPLTGSFFLGTSPYSWNWTPLSPSMKNIQSLW